MSSGEPRELLWTIPPMTCIVAGLLVLALVGCRKADPPVPVAPPVAPPEPTLQQAPAEAVQDLANLATEYETLQRQADQTNKKIVEAIGKYQKRGGKLPPGFGPELTDEQRQILAERIQQERAGTRILLQDIIDRDNQIRDLRGQLSELGAKLPDRVTTKAGDRHDRLAMSYLLSKGVSTQKAFEIVSQVNLVDGLVPGFTVWMFYLNGQFGTWVSRGSATVTPQDLQLRQARLLQAERDQAKVVAEELKREVAMLSGSQEKLQADTKSASDEAGAVMEQLAKERADRVKAEEARRAVENVIRYVVGSKSQLQKMKVIDGRLKLISFAPTGVLSLDTIEGTTVSVDATTYGLKQIRKVTLVPEIFTPGVDYQLQTDGPFATVRLVNLDKFRRNQFVIVIE